jgi:hypothetical protein
MSKICTGCENSSGKKSIVKTRAPWVKKMGRTNHPPITFLPNPRNLIKVSINIGKKYANRFIYYFAAESKYMLQQDNKQYNKITPVKAYDDFENNGVIQLDKHGKGNLVFSKPLDYYVKEDDKRYLPHIHYKISSKDGRSWLKNNHTIQI